MPPKLELVHVSSRAPEWKPKSAQGTEQRAAWAASTMINSERFAALAAEKLSCEGFEGARVLLVGFSNACLCDTRQKLRSIGVTATASVPSFRQLEDVSRMVVGFTHVFVDFDAFESVEDAVDVLIAFRSTAPGVFVLAFSETVSGDDLGRERARICDATLRLPISVPRLRNGLVTAELNHAETY